LSGQTESAGQNRHKIEGEALRIRCPVLCGIRHSGPAPNYKAHDDGTTTGTYVYDAAYRKVSETIDYGTFEKTFSYAYLDNGLKASFTGPDGITYSYIYDANNQLVIKMGTSMFLCFTSGKVYDIL
jgi:hypothetical protein